MMSRQVEGSFEEYGVAFGEGAVSFGNNKLSTYLLLPFSFKKKNLIQIFFFIWFLILWYCPPSFPRVFRSEDQRGHSCCY